MTSPLPASPGENGSVIGMVAAFSWEVTPLLRREKGVQRLGRNLYSFLLGKEPVVLAIAGVGVDNAFRVARNLVQNFSLRGLFTLGFAGALIRGLQPGDVVLADQVLEEGSQERFHCQTGLLPVRFTRRGSLLCTAGMVGSSEAKRRLGEDSGAIAVDMESAGVARAALLGGLPFCAIKSIADSLEQSISIDFERCRREHDGLSGWNIVREGFRSLAGVKDLWRLAGSSRRAAGGLAAALGSG